MDYLDKRSGWDGTNDYNVLKAQNSLSNNETFSILKKEGYLIRFIAPFKNAIEKNGLEEFFNFMSDDLIPLQTLPGSVSSTIDRSLEFKYSPMYDEDIRRKYQSILFTTEKIKKTTIQLFRNGTKRKTTSPITRKRTKTDERTIQNRWRRGQVG